MGIPSDSSRFFPFFKISTFGFFWILSDYSGAFGLFHIGTFKFLNSIQVVLKPCRYVQTAEFSKFFQIFQDSSRFSQISTRFPRILQIFSIFFILSDYSGCFQMLSVCFQSNFFRFYQTPSGILKIFSNFSVLFRSFQMPADSFKFFQIPQVCVFFLIRFNFSKFFKILSDSPVPSVFFTNL